MQTYVLLGAKEMDRRMRKKNIWTHFPKLKKQPKQQRWRFEGRLRHISIDMEFMKMLVNSIIAAYGVCLNGNVFRWFCSVLFGSFFIWCRRKIADSDAQYSQCNHFGNCRHFGVSSSFLPLNLMFITHRHTRNILFCTLLQPI